MTIPNSSANLGIQEGVNWNHKQRGQKAEMVFVWFSPSCRQVCQNPTTSAYSSHSNCVGFTPWTSLLIQTSIGASWQSHIQAYGVYPHFDESGRSWSRPLTTRAPLRLNPWPIKVSYDNSATQSTVDQVYCQKPWHYLKIDCRDESRNSFGGFLMEEKLTSLVVIAFYVRMDEVTGFDNNDSTMSGFERHSGPEGRRVSACLIT
jgi:hypothetical protein